MLKYRLGWRRRAVVAAVGIPLLLLGVVRVAPLDAPEGRGAFPGTVVLDARGTVLERDRREGSRIPVDLGAIAPTMLQATVSAEDRRFRQHPGVDPLAVARALWNGGSQPSGASTITQQLARRLYLAADDAPLLVRKAREALLALQLEAHRSKDQLLALYLNDVYYGRGAYGVEAAARAYFGIGARDLDLAHAAYLAGLPQRPSAYDPANGDGPARARQRYVLERMVEDGAIARADADRAAARPLEVLADAPAPLARHFVAYAFAELARVRPDLAGRPGLVVETTLDAGLQMEADRLMRRHLEDLSRRNVTNGALVAIEPASGRILALVGSATDGDPAHGGEINMALQPRQPGSALKPFLYAAAFERGYTPATPLLDVSTTFTTDEGPYTPLNFDRAFHGVVPLRVALASSLNVPAVRTLDAIGLDAMLEVAHRVGLATLSDVERYGLSLTLGGGEVRLLDLTAAYATLAAGGARAEPFAVTRVRDREGRVVYEHQPSAPRAVLRAQHAFLLTDILSDADARIAGFGYRSPFELPFPAAAKSGTTTGFRDNWTVGFTPEVALGVWVGNADGSPMIDVSGVAGAAPIWRDAMVAAALARPMSPFVRPPGIVETIVCAPTGLLPGADCPSPRTELFAAGTEPTERERYYRRDGDGRLSIDPPVEARTWARDAGFSLASEERDAETDALHIVSPASGSVFFLSPELGEQLVVLRASATRGVERVIFELDGRRIGEAPASDARLVWTLEAGTHSLRATAVGADGVLASAVATYEVKAR